MRGEKFRQVSIWRKNWGGMSKKKSDKEEEVARRGTRMKRQ